MMKAWVKAAIVCAVAIVTVPLCVANGTAQDAAGFVLAEVNGEPITGADLEALIVDAHQGGGIDGGQRGLIPKLLERAIREELMLQDAAAIGMFEEADLTAPVIEECRYKSISLFARATIELPEVSEAEVQAYFDRYYHKIQLRQITATTPEECRELRARIGEEEPMGTLAAKYSIDRFKERGGLRDDAYWRDLDPALREATRDVEIGGYSESTQVAAGWAFVRVESRTDPDPADLARFRAGIHRGIQDEKYQAAWKEAVDQYEGQVVVRVDQALLEAVRADEELLYRGEFKWGSNARVLEIDDRHFVTDLKFREEMSREAMSMAQSSIDEILDYTTDLLRERLVMAYIAEREGYLDDPEVVEFYDSEMSRVVLDTYLAEFIGSKVRFKRDDYDQFYQDHLDDFRRDDQVMLSFMSIPDQQTAQQTALRLQEGADFDYLRQEIEGRESASSTDEGTWTEITFFSDQIRSELAQMSPTDTSNPILVGRKWMIIRLDGRREGEVASIEEVDGAIRQALYIREFTRLLDEHVARLAEVSVIIRHEDRILEWADSDS